MYALLVILMVVVAILMCLIVLIQNSKGGGLASSFASGNQVMGAPKTADFLEKASWTLIAFIVVLSVGAVWVSKGNQEADPSESAIKEQVQQAAEQMAPAAPAADFDTEATEAE